MQDSDKDKSDQRNNMEANSLPTPPLNDILSFSPNKDSNLESHHDSTLCIPHHYAAYDTNIMAFFLTERIVDAFEKSAPQNLRDQLRQVIAHFQSAKVPVILNAFPRMTKQIAIFASVLIAKRLEAGDPFETMPVHIRLNYLEDSQFYVRFIYIAFQLAYKHITDEKFRTHPNGSVDRNIPHWREWEIDWLIALDFKLDSVEIQKRFWEAWELYERQEFYVHRNNGRLYQSHVTLPYHISTFKIGDWDQTNPETYKYDNIAYGPEMTSEVWGSSSCESI